MNFKNTKVRIAVVLGAILLLGTAFTAGRLSRPEKVVIKEEFKEKIVEVTDQKAVAEAVSKAQAEWKRNEKTHSGVRIIYKDGQIVEKIVYRDRESTDAGSTSSSASSSSSTSSSSSASVETEKTKEKTVIARIPRFRAGLGMGAQWDRPLVLVYEGHAEARIVGGLWGGIEAIPQLSFVGLTLSFQY